MSVVTTTSTRKRSRTPTSSRRLFSGKRFKGVSPMTNRSRVNRMTIQRQTVYVGRGPVAKKTVVWLKYADNFSSTGAAIDKVYRLNSIFDPDHTGTGHQPLGRDQYVNFYNRYRVLKVRMKLHVASAYVADAQPFIVTIVPDNATTAHTSVTQSAEQQGASTHSPTGGSPGSIVIKRSFDCRKITGVTSKEYQDDRFQALFSTSPAEDIMLHITATDYTGGVFAVNIIRFFIELSFQVEMFDPVPLGQS